MRVGALAWMLAAQFFAAQVIVASAWTTNFSLKERVISDLGNTVCGPSHKPRSADACSPWHAVMNGSFVMVGITMAGGALLTSRAFRSGWPRSLAVPLFVAAGAGVLIVGLYPENESGTNHDIGAAINFVAGNTALVLYGVAFPSSRFWLRWLSIVAGLAGLLATILFALHHDLGIGPGGIERVAAYTTSTWQIIVGLIFWRHARSDTG